MNFNSNYFSQRAGEIYIPENVMPVSKSNLQGIITEVNQDLIDICGCDEAQLLGQTTVSAILHPDVPSEVKNDIWLNLRKNRPWTGITKIKNHKDDSIPVVDNVPDDGFKDDADIEHLVGTVTNFHVEGDSLYADTTVLDEFVETLKKFKKNGIELYLSPAITGRVNGNETIIESGKPTFFTVKPASKWRKPFLDE